MRYANFADGSHVNLIKLRSPYATGHDYAIHQTTKSPLCQNEMHKGFYEANERFERMVSDAALESPIIECEFTANRP